MNLQPIVRSTQPGVQRTFIACIVCGKDSGWADLDGVAYHAYYCVEHKELLDIILADG